MARSGTSVELSCLLEGFWHFSMYCLLRFSNGLLYVTNKSCDNLWSSVDEIFDSKNYWEGKKNQTPKEIICIFLKDVSICFFPRSWGRNSVWSLVLLNDIYKGTWIYSPSITIEIFEERITSHAFYAYSVSNFRLCFEERSTQCTVFVFKLLLKMLTVSSHNKAGWCLIKY